MFTSRLRIFFLILSYSLFSSVLWGQESKTVLQKVLKNGTELSEDANGVFIFKATDEIKFILTVEPTSKAPEKIKYKLLLDQKEYGDGTPLHSPIVLNGLSSGNHLVRFQAYFDDGSVASSVTTRFAVERTTETKNEIIENNGMENIKNILLIVLSVGLLGSLILYFRKGSGSKVVIVDKDENEELSEVKEAHEKLKDSYAKLREENHQLSTQISQLKLSLRMLEEGNIKLLEQKEQLLRNKEQLESLQQQKEDFFAIKLHDLKNPAGAIKGLVELLESYDLNANEQQEVMVSLIKSSEYIIKLATEVSTVMGKKKVDNELELEKIQIKDIIDAVHRMNMAYASKKNVNLINNVSGTLPEIVADAGKIQEVLDNLINNAIKFAPENTLVQIRSYFNEQKLTVEVMDNGVGLSAEEIQKAFTRGGTLSVKPTGGEKSSGLGLWAVKKIVEMHSGKVWVKSRVGSGSTFAFELPIVANKKEGPATP